MASFTHLARAGPLVGVCSPLNLESDMEESLRSKAATGI